MTALITLLLLGAQPTSAAPHVVFIVGENEYGSYETVPDFAEELKESLGVRTTILRSDRRRRTLPDLDVLNDADLIFLALRFRRATDEQLERLKEWFEEGRPAIALRTTSHAFQGEEDWFPPFFGGHYKGHADNEEGTTAMVTPAAVNHPVTRGMERTVDYGHGGVYFTQPLADTATVLMLGRTGDLPAEPVAWTNRYKPDSRILYTSLGSRENFENKAFRRFLTGAVRWCLGDGEFEEPKPAQAPPPPTRTPPADAAVLFDGATMTGFRHWDPSVPPLAIELDRRADTSAAGPFYDEARWRVEGGAMVARPGFGDVLSDLRMGHHHLHLDFWVPPSPDWVTERFRGRGGVYLGGLVELEIADHINEPMSDLALGSILGEKGPDAAVGKPAGQWQSLDVAYRHDEGEPARATVWLNGVRIHDDVTLPERTPGGFLDVHEDEGDGPGSERGRKQWDPETSRRDLDLGKGRFTWVSRFRTQDGGTLLSKSPRRGEWRPNAKALFVRGGRLVYDIGWVGAITSRTAVADGRWHHAALTYRDGAARLYVDGKLEATREGFTAPDEGEHVLKAGAASTNFAGRFTGDIEYAAHIAESLDDEAIASIARSKPLIQNAKEIVGVEQVKKKLTGGRVLIKDWRCRESW